MSGGGDGGYPIGDPKILTVALKVRDVMEALGVDRREPNLHGTEFRVARALGALVAGLDPGAERLRQAFLTLGSGRPAARHGSGLADRRRSRLPDPGDAA